MKLRTTRLPQNDTLSPNTTLVRSVEAAGRSVKPEAGADDALGDVEVLAIQRPVLLDMAFLAPQRGRRRDHRHRHAGAAVVAQRDEGLGDRRDRKSTRLNSSH